MISTACQSAAHTLTSIRKHLFSAAQRVISSQSAAHSAAGFSTRTCFPALRHNRACGVPGRATGMGG